MPPLHGWQQDNKITLNLARAISHLVCNRLNAGELDKAVNISNPNENGTIIYTITVTNNNGPSDATGIMVTDILPDFFSWADQICACGPLDMYKAMSLTLNPSPSKGKGEKQSNLRCQVSLEVRMGCGIGACRSCTINTRHGLKQVCRDGPVFELNDILWQEVRI